MDSFKPSKPAHLLDDLESIRQLLEKDQLEPPLLTESLDNDLQIPLLSDIVEPAPQAAGVQPPAPSIAPLPYPVRPAAATPTTIPPSTPSTPAPPAIARPTQSIASSVQETVLNRSRLDAELRAAAQLILQDVIDDFVPQIEAELKRRLDARLDRLLVQRKP